MTAVLRRPAAAPAPPARRRVQHWLRASCVFAVAFGARLTVLLRDGGLHGYIGYDASVYFGAADALTRGRMPYRDFVLLHPPGLMLALTPFAALTRVLSDDNAFTVGVLAFCALGALNAVLVTAVCRRIGFGGAAALAGGVFYALWYGSVGAEYLIRLEPLGNLLLLLALLGVLGAQRRVQDATCGTRTALLLSALSGAALGAAVSVKIWWVVPAVAVAVWHCVRTRRAAHVAALVAGALVSACAINLPFFVADPSAMWQAVIVDQVGRRPIHASRIGRIADLSSATAFMSHTSRAELVVLAVAVIGVLVACAVQAYQVRVARPAVVLLAVQLTVLLAAPSWFPFYTDYVAVPLAVTVAGAVAAECARQRSRVSWLGAGQLACATCALVCAFILGTGVSAVQPRPGAARLTRAVAGVRCVMSDSPMGEIEVDALSRGLSAGCRDWIDVTGRTYGPDKPARTGEHRRDNPRWQRDLTHYLRSGGAVLIVRGPGTEPDSRTWAAIRRDGVLERAGGQVVYRTGPATRG